MRTCSSRLATTLTLATLLIACGEPEEATSGQQPSITARAVELQQKTEQQLLETAEKAQQAALATADKTRRAAAEATERAGAATEAAGKKVQQAAQALNGKALSHPQRLPETTPESAQPSTLP